MLHDPPADAPGQLSQQSEHPLSNSSRTRLMADRDSQQSPQINPYLSQNQQDLLVAALNSQAGGREASFPPPDDFRSAQSAPSDPHSASATMNGVDDSSLYISPQQVNLDDFPENYSPDLNYLDADGFDFENADLGGEMIGALPGESGNGAALHEKRKNSEEDGAAEEGDAKRQETQEGEKSAKKPGRKPLTSEPTTKRKAQNRAAQRAFRERKEQHLKDLETTVSDLRKAKEADRHENGLLKAKIERLEVELRDTRKRLSLNSGSGPNRSPSLGASGGQMRSNSNPSAYGNFAFDFPKFGALPGSQYLPGQSLPNGSNSSLQNASNPFPVNAPTAGIIGMQSSPVQYGSRQNSAGPSMSPVSMNGTSTESPANTGSLDASFASYSTIDNMHGFGSTLPQMGNANDPFGDLFSPGLLKSANADTNGNYFAKNGEANVNGVADNNGGDSTAGLNRVFQFNSGSNGTGSDSASPSASSASQWNGNANSSCGTSPEPSHGSPGYKSLDKTNGQRNQSPLATTNQVSLDYNIPSLTSFDPVLFGDYRDTQDAVVGGGDFSGGFFDDAMPPFDYNSPSNLFGILQSPQLSNTTLNATATTQPTNVVTNPSKQLMAEMDKVRDGGDDDYGLPAAGIAPPPATSSQKAGDGKFISCNSIWTQLQTNPDFQEGKFDLDSLCSELKAKARCSESGVIVDQSHVDAAIRKLGKKDESTGKVFEGPTGLMFEQESWDNVLKKMDKSKA